MGLGKKILIGVGVVFAGLIILAALTSGGGTKTDAPPTDAPAVTVTEAPVVQPTVAPTVVPTEMPTVAPVSNETISQQNAVEAAKDYLDVSAFSHDGLVDQLEFEQFSHADAVYGADNSGANWNEQAAASAKSYMEISAFSRGSLIDQLTFEKFTQEQAEYGADAVGL